MRKLAILVLPILFLFACGADPSNDNDPVEPTAGETPTSTVEKPEPEPVVPTETNLNQFFLTDGSSAQFLGDGNEYASYSLKTQWMNENYVATYEDNGGTVMQRIYRISTDKISLLAENGEAYDAQMPSVEELEAKPEIGIYLSTPLEVGTEFNDWIITSTSETVETSLQMFTDVIVIEKKEEQGNLNRKYFAKEFGEIKREFIMHEGEQEIIISSTIEKVM
jgi:hypothetical protein